MHNMTLTIKAQNQPTVLERLLQVTRYRGFCVVNLSVKPSVKHHFLNIKLTVQSVNKNEFLLDSHYQKLSNQLTKLFDIRQIDLLAGESIKSQRTSVQLKAFSH